MTFKMLIASKKKTILSRLQLGLNASRLGHGDSLLPLDQSHVTATMC